MAKFDSWSIEAVLSFAKGIFTAEACATLEAWGKGSQIPAEWLLDVRSVLLRRMSETDCDSFFDALLKEKTRPRHDDSRRSKFCDDDENPWYSNCLRHLEERSCDS